MDTTTPAPLRSGTSNGLLGKVKYAFTLSTILALLSTNIATVASDTAHASLFDGLRQALGYILADTVVDSLLSHSPTTVRNTDIARKTARQTAEIHQLRNTVASAESNNKKLIADKIEIDNRHQKLTADHADLQAKHQKMSVDHDDLNDRHTKLANDHQQQVKTNRIRQEKLRAVSSRMAPRLGEIGTKSIATLPGRMAPYIGTAATVAFTAWELTELCNLMNDLDELNVTFSNAFNDPTKVCGLPRPTVFSFN